MNHELRIYIEFRGKLVDGWVGVIPMGGYGYANECLCMDL